MDCCSLLEFRFLKDNQFVIECIGNTSASLCFQIFLKMVKTVFLYLLYGRKIDKSDLVSGSPPLRQLTKFCVCENISVANAFFVSLGAGSGGQVYLSQWPEKRLHCSGHRLLLGKLFALRRGGVDLKIACNPQAHSLPFLHS